MRIPRRRVEPLKRCNRYSTSAIMARKDGGLFWCRVRGHSLTRDDDPLKRAVMGVSPDLSETRHVLRLTTRERQIVMHLAKAGHPRRLALHARDSSPRTVGPTKGQAAQKNARPANVAEMLSHLSNHAAVVVMGACGGRLMTCRGFPARKSASEWAWARDFVDFADVSAGGAAFGS